MVGEAVRASVVARFFGRMMGIGLAIGDVTATNSVYEWRNNMGALQICTVTPHVCRPARRKLSSSQRAIATCLERRGTFLGTKSRKVENDSARWWRRQTL